MLLILFGLLLVAISLLADRKSNTTCEPSSGEVKYLPRNLDMMMKDAEDVGVLFRPMFESNLGDQRYQ